MSREPFHLLRSRAVVLDRDDVDTDQIIPARFLTTTERTGLGRHLFADWRLDPAGVARPDFVLHTPGANPARVLIAGRNFGCGSSREHAAWALMDWGFRAVVAISFGDIFASNAHKNGLLTVALGADAHARLVGALSARPDLELAVDLRERSLRLGAVLEARFQVDPFVALCLGSGIDELDYLLAATADIAAWEQRQPAFPPINDPLADQRPRA